jgi:tetratricopeptide (TPR) repeat protein
MESELRRAAQEHFERGNSFDENGHSERAIAEWQQAIQLDPDHGEAHYNLGISYADEGETALAIAEFRQAVRLDSFDTDARRELAEVCLEAGQTDDAINQLRQILSIASGDALAAHRLAQVYLDQNRIDEAAGALEAGGVVEPDADLWFQLGERYQRDDRVDDAVLAYRRALCAQPEHADASMALRRLNVPFEDPVKPEE